MGKKEYHGFDVEEEELTGCDDIISSSACITTTFHGWSGITVYNAITSAYMDQCSSLEDPNEDITINYDGYRIE